MVAYHFPPLAGSSGIQRTLRFVQQLPALGWQPLVLTTHPRAYDRTNIDLLSDVPTGTVVRRAFALDTARHLSIGGRHIGAMARPDRWISWRFDGVRTGLSMIDEWRPQAIWTTYPIATAHRIGIELHRRTGLPWIADFRDPMAQDDYPSDPKTWASFLAIEQDVFSRASACLFTTPGAAAMYRDRYPQSAERIAVLENGYDEDSFIGLPVGGAPIAPGKVTLLHSGIVYPDERDPRALLAALARLRSSHPAIASQLRIRFRAAVHDDLLRRLATEAGVHDAVEVLPPIGYRDALAEMLRADGLLVLQAANCNAQVPAKLYEYLRTRRPIIGLTDAAGDTAQVMRDAGVDVIAPLDNAEAIAALIARWWAQRADGKAPIATERAIAAAGRQARSVELSQWLNRLTAS